MPFAQVSFLRSFRFRVIAGLFVVVVGTMALTTVLVRAILNPSILLTFDRQLFDESDETILDIRALYPQRIPPDWESTPHFEDLKHILERRARSRGNLHWFIRLFDDKKRLVYESERLPDIPLPIADDSDKARDVGEFRWVDAYAPSKGAPLEFWVQTGRSNQALAEDFELLNRTLFLRGIFVLLLAPVGGYFLARQVTGPIANIITTASRLQPQNLSERLPIRGVNDELDKVSQTINGMLDRIANYVEKNRAFVANAAHELRSPLAAMRSTAEVALNRSRTPEEYANVLSEIVEEVGRLSSMVNRLLLLAEGDAGRLVSGAGQAARLDKMIREAVEMFQAVAESVNVELRLSPLPPVDVPGDESNVRHLVRNLIDNAIKFSQPGGVVNVTLRSDREKECAIFAVTDQGDGISPEDLPRLFERFFRGDRSRNRDEGRGGTGLGLSICHAIVSAMGGEIAVSSAVGAGSTFTVTLPLHRL